MGGSEPYLFIVMQRSDLVSIDCIRQHKQHKIRWFRLSKSSNQLRTSLCVSNCSMYCLCLGNVSTRTNMQPPYSFVALCTHCQYASPPVDSQECWGISLSSLGVVHGQCAFPARTNRGLSPGGALPPRGIRPLVYDRGFCSGSPRCPQWMHTYVAQRMAFNITPERREAGFSMRAVVPSTVLGLHTLE